ncbi:MAG: glucokinase [Deltaproteobacteria bacterium]|nr:glucokinase [Deltaproteobacteria bacterium]
MILAGDIGGTKTHIGLFQQGKRRPRLRVLETYPSRAATGLDELVNAFLKDHPSRIAAACFGVAGPVVNGVCRTTNLPWMVSEARIARVIRGERVLLLNDLAATAWALPLLSGRELHALNRPRPKKDQNSVLLAPGTGLGIALIIAGEKDRTPVPSEGGHVDFAPREESHIELWRYLCRRFGHASIERVLSGPGLVHIYTWLRDSGRYRESARIGNLLREEDPARAISEAALAGGPALCMEALRIFVDLLGAAAGNLALTGMATGGVYLGGGIPPKILPFLREGPFLEAFADKGRFRPLLERISVRVILNERAALLGAARAAADSLEGTTV